MGGNGDDDNDGGDGDEEVVGNCDADSECLLKVGW